MKPKPVGEETVVFKSRLFEVVKQPFDEGSRVIHYETVRRSPGVRLIIVKDNKILLTNEYRTELDSYDYRLPGGKVFDSLDEYNFFLTSEGDILDAAKLAAQKECREEVGLHAQSIEHIWTTAPGSTISWDLYYFLVNNFSEEKGQNLESGELIEPVWKTFDEVKNMCVEGKIREDRSVGVLMRLLYQKRI